MKGRVGKGKESGSGQKTKQKSSANTVSEPAQNTTLNPVEKMWNNKYDARWDKEPAQNTKNPLAEGVLSPKTKETCCMCHGEIDLRLGRITDFKKRLYCSWGCFNEKWK